MRSVFSLSMPPPFPGGCVSLGPSRWGACGTRRVGFTPAPLRVRGIWRCPVLPSAQSGRWTDGFKSGLMCSAFLKMSSPNACIGDLGSLQQSESQSQSQSQSKTLLFVGQKVAKSLSRGGTGFSGAVGLFIEYAPALPGRLRFSRLVPLGSMRDEACRFYAGPFAGAGDLALPSFAPAQSGRWPDGFKSGLMCSAFLKIHPRVFLSGIFVRCGRAGAPFLTGYYQSKK